MSVFFLQKKIHKNCDETVLSRTLKLQELKYIFVLLISKTLKRINASLAHATLSGCGRPSPKGQENPSVSVWMPSVITPPALILK